MKTLYHGSALSNLQELIPFESTHGKFVYATPFKELALIFAGQAGDDLIYSLYRNNPNEPWNIVELVPEGFKTCFSNAASLYTISADNFQSISTTFPEVVSPNKVLILKEEKISNVYQMLKKIAQENLIKMYYYPNKPQNFNIDLLDITFNQIKRTSQTIEKATFARLLFLHPYLLSKLNARLKKEFPNFSPYTKEDLLFIFKRYLAYQQANPQKIIFLKSALMNLAQAYPQIATQLKSTKKELSFQI